MRTCKNILAAAAIAVTGLCSTTDAVLDPLMKRWIGGRTALGTPGVRWFGVEYGLPGVRVTLWFGGLLILVAATLASRSIDPSAARGGRARRRATVAAGSEDLS